MTHSANLLISLNKIFHLRQIQSQTSLLIVSLQNLKRSSHREINNFKWVRLSNSEHLRYIRLFGAEVLGHPVVENISESRSHRHEFCESYQHSSASLNAFYLFQTTNQGDTGSFWAPWRDVSWSNVVDFRKFSWKCLLVSDYLIWWNGWEFRQLSGQFQKPMTTISFLWSNITPETILSINKQTSTFSFTRHEEYFNFSA